MLRHRSRHPTVIHSFSELPWLQPYPDRLLDEIAPSKEQPDAVVVERVTIEPAFVASMQVLTPRQRAVFIVGDVPGWPASETAPLLGMSVATANSALQRARSTMQAHLATRRTEWSSGELSNEERVLLDKFIDAHERCDAAAAVAISAQDIRIAMPPNPFYFQGIQAIMPLLERALGEGRDGDWRLVAVKTNRMPVAPSYLRLPESSEFRAFTLDVLRIKDRQIAEITTFGAGLFPAFRLPTTL